MTGPWLFSTRWNLQRYSGNAATRMQSLSRITVSGVRDIRLDGSALRQYFVR